MIALETLIEQDPDELEKKVEKEYPNLEFNYSIEEQMTSIMDLLSVPKNNKDDANKSIKKAYGHRSKIIHNGIQLFDNNGNWNYMLSMWYTHLFTIITTIIFENNWKTKYNLWKEANHVLNKKEQSNMNKVSDSDWKLYRSLLPKWQERYMAKLNKEYIEILSENNNPSTNFWKLEKRIRQDRKSLGVSIIVRLSDFFIAILSLINTGVITREDLADFSKDVTDWVDQSLE